LEEGLPLKRRREWARSSTRKKKQRKWRGLKVTGRKQIEERELSREGKEENRGRERSEFRSRFIMIILMRSVV
jgi:hypothetical protein